MNWEQLLRHNIKLSSWVHLICVLGRMCLCRCHVAQSLASLCLIFRPLYSKWNHNLNELFFLRTSTTHSNSKLSYRLSGLIMQAINKNSQKHIFDCLLARQKFVLILRPQPKNLFTRKSFRKKIWTN